MSAIPKNVAELPTSAPRFVGRAVNRVEDPLLLTGRAEFIDAEHAAEAAVGDRGRT